jgi:hypothetical protein
MPFVYDDTIPGNRLPYVRTTAKGIAFGKLTDAVATIATAIPTTSAVHVLYNGEPTGGKTYALDLVTWYGITSAAAASAFGMLGCLNTTPLTTQPATADTLTAVTSMNGKVYAGFAATSHTVTVVDTGWWPMPMETAFPGAGTVTGGVVLTSKLEGRVLIPPKCIFAVSVTSVATTATGNLFFRWTEEQIINTTS